MQTSAYHHVGEKQDLISSLRCGEGSGRRARDYGLEVINELSLKLAVAMLNGEEDDEEEEQEGFVVTCGLECA